LYNEESSQSSLTYSLNNATESSYCDSMVGGSPRGNEATTAPRKVNYYFEEDNKSL
jgi:hypothetical protein